MTTSNYVASSVIYPDDEKRILFRKGQQYSLNLGQYSDTTNVFTGVPTRDISVAEFKRIQFGDITPTGKSFITIIGELVDLGALKPVNTISYSWKMDKNNVRAREMFADLFYEQMLPFDGFPNSVRESDGVDHDYAEPRPRDTDISEAAIHTLDKKYNKRSTNMFMTTEIDFSDVYGKPEKEDNTVTVKVAASDSFNGNFFIRPVDLLNKIDDLISSGYHVTVNVVNDPEFWRKYPLLKAICGKYPPTCSGPVVGDVNIYANDASGEMVYYAIRTSLNSTTITRS